MSTKGMKPTEDLSTYNHRRYGLSHVSLLIDLVKFIWWAGICSPHVGTGYLFRQ